MSDKSIRERVVSIIATQLQLNEDTLQDSSHLLNDLGADSLDTVELVMAFEEEFKSELGGNDIPDTDSEKLMTVGSIVAYIEEKMQK